jgi:transcription termination factor Rho
MNLRDIKNKSSTDLLRLAESLEIQNSGLLKRQDLIFAILKKQAEKEVTLYADGVIEILPDGFGFLRSESASYLPGADDIYVSPQQVRHFALKTGDVVEGIIVSPKETERYFALSKILKVNFGHPSAIRNRIAFDNLTPLFPDRKLRLESDLSKSKDLTLRVIDLVVPLGFGQRALIVAPPRTGRWVVL